jgi:ribosomal protein S18 acetylase RimI-like enzyme
MSVNAKYLLTRANVPPNIRPLQPADRLAVERILESTRNFTPSEIATALELVDAWLTTGAASGYHCLVVDTSDTSDTSDTNSAASHPDVRGYACYGPTPLTDGTFDLYWIAVERASHGTGFGRTLLQAVERDARGAHGRLLLIETSSQESYGATIRFYERNAYTLAARIPNFYRTGDDKLVFAKNL